MPNQPNPAVIFEAFRAYQQSFALKAGIELDIFTAIAQGHDTPRALAELRKASERGMRILCDFLTISGLLIKTGSHYSLTSDTAFFLDSRSPAYMGKAAKFLLHPQQLGFAQNLTATIAQGSLPNDGCLEPEDPIWVDFARGMAPMMVPAAHAIAQTLKDSFKNIEEPKILDIAAGHGIFGITVAKQFPQARIHAVDWANVLEVARQNATTHEVAERHFTIPGSAFDVDYGTNYDAALLTNFLHHFDQATNETLLQKVRAALKPGGQLVILEFVPNDDRISPAASAAFSLTMLCATPNGDAYTFAELSKMCGNAGFEDMLHVPLGPSPQSLVVARNPAR